MENDSLTKFENFVIFQTEDGKVNIDVYFQNDTLWLTQKAIAELFEKGRATITEHLKKIFSDGELNQDAVCRDFRHTAEEDDFRSSKLTYRNPYFTLRGLSKIRGSMFYFGSCYEY